MKKTAGPRMGKTFVLLMMLLTAAFAGQAQGMTEAQKGSRNAGCGYSVLWYDHPAANWNEALPLGNGRLGAMVFGTPATGHLQLNEETVWSGGPNNNIN